MNKANDSKLKQLLSVLQFFLVSTIGDVWRTVRKTCVLKLECERVSTMAVLNIFRRFSKP